jgi:hypothetical protein
MFKRTKWCFKIRKEYAMAERNLIKPTPYSKTDTAEVAAVTIFESLVNGKTLSWMYEKETKSLTLMVMLKL